MYNPQLDTFMKVCETGSFSKAAQALFITPSAVVQQINLLEKDLNVSLFNRSKRGVVLTKAGEYLSVQAGEYIRQGEQIRSALSMFSMQEDVICIGTSMMEKCRLLFDLWMLFYQKNQRYKVQLVNFDSDQKALSQSELVECVQDGAPWQKGWNFLSICTVPLGLAVSKDHPLSDKEKLTWNDIRQTQMVVIDRGGGTFTAPIYERLKQEGVCMEVRTECGSSLIWECSAERKALLAPLCWDDVIFDLKMKPCEWDFSIPYGIFYKTDLTKPAEQFITYIRDLYAGREDSEVIPVLY